MTIRTFVFPLALLLLPAAGCGIDGATPTSAQTLPVEAPKVSVRVADVQHGAVSQPIRGTGTVSARTQLDLGFLVGGKVAWVGPHVGARVHKGDVIARLDATTYDADEARANLALEKANRDFGRANTLHSVGGLPARDVEDATTARDVATETLRSAKFARAHAVLIAPDDGTVDVRLVEPGAVVASGQPLFRLSSQTRGAVVRVSVTDHDVVNLNIGSHATVTLDADGTKYDGAISEIATTASPGSGTFIVEVKLSNVERALPSGLTAKVAIDRMVSAGARVPLEAVVDGNGRDAAVWTVERGVTKRIAVHIAFLAGAEALLVEQLPGVDAVITDGALSVGEGVSVEVAQ